MVIVFQHFLTLNSPFSIIQAPLNLLSFYIQLPKKFVPLFKLLLHITDKVVNNIVFILQ